MVALVGVKDTMEASRAAGLKLAAYNQIRGALEAVTVGVPAIVQAVTYSATRTEESAWPLLLMNTLPM
jgi:hypothetical protein